ncbi:MAG: hypothetical protein WCW16_01010 [Candidatus Magasanikbacteria bacterium]|jgi:hypothetical protein
MLHYFHEKRRQHRMWVLLIGLLLLLFLTVATALLFGMSKTGLLVLFPLFVLFIVLIDLGIEHY